MLEKLLTVILSAATGWLISAATKVSNAKLENTISELEKRVISPLVTKLDRLELKSEFFITRSDVKELVTELKANVEARHLEIRRSMNGIFRELRDLRDRRPIESNNQRTAAFETRNGDAE